MAGMTTADVAGMVATYTEQYDRNKMEANVARAFIAELHREYPQARKECEEGLEYIEVQEAHREYEAKCEARRSWMFDH